MQQKNRYCLIAGLALLFAGEGAFAQIESANVTGGRVAGTVAQGVTAFKGIPFAAPPLGKFRWRAPQPVTPWSGERKAEAFGASCMQPAAMVSLMSALTKAVSEDCLYLNVWTAAKSDHEKRPVMVWIYGGAFAAGMTSSPTYDGSHFAKQGVVLVSVAYRVGPMGFLAHPDLTKEGDKTSGNYGLQDMIAGLTWVKRNIGQFGGDPANVTIFGESAGGIAVSMLTASPAAKGLFQRAISESGGSFGGARQGTEGGMNVQPLRLAEDFGKEFLAKLGANDLTAARALSAEKIQAAQPNGLGGGFWPNFDGQILLGDQYLLYSAGKFNDTPVLIGTNSDEGALFTPPAVSPPQYEQQVRAGYGDGAAKILAANPHADAAQSVTAARNLFRDSVFGWPTWAWATLQSQKGHNKAFVYYFDHHAVGSPIGANHGSEIIYVFGTVGLPGTSLAGPVTAPTAADLSISKLMNAYWVNFATKGDPNGPGLPSWPAFNSKAQEAMVLDDSPSARPLPNQAQLHAMDEYFRWRREHAAK